MQPDDPGLEGDTSTRTRELLTGLRAATGTPCAGCRQAICGHEAVLSWVLGYRADPRCGACLAAAMSEDRPTMTERALQWIRRRECFLRGWLWASALEGTPGAERPPCQFPAGAAGPTAAAAAPAATSPPDAVAPDDAWDAGQLGCGDLVLELRNRLRGMDPGSVLHVRAEDPAAPVDLPAWCGLTGHTLLRASHPEYLIMRRESP